MTSVPQVAARRRLKTRQAASYLGLGESTLEKLRVFGGGPVYEKLGRSVVYDVDDLEHWAKSRKRSHTSEVIRRMGS